MTNPSFFRRLFRSEFLLPLVAGVMLRLAVFPLAHLQHPEVRQQWEYEYSTIAQNMVAGRGYSYNWSYAGKPLTFPTAYMLPGEVMLQYAALAVFGDTLAGHIALFIEGVALGGVFILGMWKLLALLFGHGQRATRVGVWLAAIYPSFVLVCTTYGIASAVLAIDALFLWLIVLCLAKVRTGERPVLLAIGVGVMAGAMTQFRSESYLLLTITATVIVWLYRKSFRVLSPYLSIATIAALVICAPWIVRNYIVFHKVIPTSNSSGFNFWRGHNDLATGSTNNSTQNDWTTPAMIAAMEPGGRVDSSFEFTQNKYDWKVALAWVRAHPTREAELAINKLTFFWGIDRYDPRGGVFYIALYALTIVSALAGIARIRREQKWRETTLRDAIAIISVWAVAYSAIVVVFFSLMRLQILMIGFYFPIVVYGADDIWAYLRRRFQLYGATTSKADPGTIRGGRSA